MKLPTVYSDNYVTPLPRGHRFPMAKFQLLYRIIRSEGIIDDPAAIRPGEVDRESLEYIHTRDYISRFFDGTLATREIRRMGLPWSPGLVTRTRTAVSGTIETARAALRYGIASNCAGGTHHAFPDFGSGFCIFNDLAVTAKIMVEKNEAKRILIIDLDVHQGDATAFSLASETRVFTFSMHCEKNFPFRKQQSDRDVALAEGTGNEKYLRVLESELPAVISAADPDLVLYDAGVDVHQSDRLGKLELTDTGLKLRDEMVLRACTERNIPVATVIGGGYDRDIDALADRHAITIRTAAEVADTMDAAVDQV